MVRTSSLVFLSAILVVVGALLTLENLGLVDGVSRHWPAFLVVLGTGFLLLFYKRDGTDLPLLWLGSFICSLGVFFYFLNFTSWRSLGRLWPVFLGLVGLSFLALGVARRSRMYSAFAVAFIGLFLIFMLVFTVSLKLWPMSLVVFGASLLILDHLIHDGSAP
jgi:uncharacterized membrane protein HdeD (DUF308 family)